MTTRYEYYNTGDDSFTTFFGATWKAQTFTSPIAHKITSVKLELYRVGSPGTVTIGIRATNGDGHPTGGDLCSGTTDGDTLPTSASPEWREINLGSGYTLDADVKYAIVARAVSGNDVNVVGWRENTTFPL